MINKIIENLESYLGPQSVETFHKIKATMEDVPHVVLYSEDRYFFVTALLAAFCMKKKVFLPHNKAENFIKSITQKRTLLLTDKTPLKKLYSSTQPLIDSKKTALVFYTSGSTGEPKAIPKTLFQLETEIECLINTFNMSRSEKFISTVPHYHIYGLLFSVLLPLYLKKPFLNSTLVLWDEVFTNLQHNDVLISSPSHLSRLEGKALYKPSHVFSSSAPLSFENAKKTQNFLGTLPHEIYGSTETGGIAYREQLDHSGKWTPFNKITITVGDDTCLHITSPYLESPYQTQDRVLIHDDKTFTLLGRNDRIAKIEGKRICLLEVEQKLALHPFIKDCVIIPILSEKRDILGAFITLKPDGIKHLNSLKKHKFINVLKGHLRLYFDSVCIPRKWKIDSQIPETRSGKRSISELQKMFESPVPD
jgi:acyl-coenzyme A synthetase/AMP-(fatty) acid ligase